jgi:hypothetical protein
MVGSTHTQGFRTDGQATRTVAQSYARRVFFTFTEPEQEHIGTQFVVPTLAGFSGILKQMIVVPAGQRIAIYGSSPLQFNSSAQRDLSWLAFPQ